jgi:hypothetical protein
LRSEHLGRSCINSNPHDSAIENRDAYRADPKRTYGDAGCIDFHIEIRRPQDSIQSAPRIQLNLSAPELKVREPDFAVFSHSNYVCAVDLDFGRPGGGRLDAIPSLKRSIHGTSDYFGRVSPADSHVAQNNAQPCHTVLLIRSTFRVLARLLFDAVGRLRFRRACGLRILGGWFELGTALQGHQQRR